MSTENEVQNLESNMRSFMENKMRAQISDKMRAQNIVEDADEHQEYIDSLKARGIPVYGDTHMPSGVYLGLFHGTKNENERRQMEDWGHNGPVIGPLDFAHTTYANNIKFRFSDSKEGVKARKLYQQLSDDTFKGDSSFHLFLEGDLLVVDGRQYGDWTVFFHRPGRLPNTYES